MGCGKAGMSGSIFLPGVYHVVDGRYIPVVSVRKVCLNVINILKAITTYHVQVNILSKYLLLINHQIPSSQSLDWYVQGTQYNLDVV